MVFSLINYLAVFLVIWISNLLGLVSEEIATCEVEKKYISKIEKQLHVKVTTKGGGAICGIQLLKCGGNYYQNFTIDEIS